MKLRRVRKNARAVCVICGCALTVENTVPYRLGGVVLFASCRDDQPRVEAAAAGAAHLAGFAARAVLQSQAPRLLRDVKKLGGVLAGLLDGAARGR